MLLSEELYDGNDLKVANDIRGLFLAGDETCNITTANLLYYFTANRHCQTKMIEETTPLLDGASSDFVNLITTDVVDGFIYTKQCVYESMRITPPGPSSMPSLFC